MVLIGRRESEEYHNVFVAMHLEFSKLRPRQTHFIIRVLERPFLLSSTCEKDVTEKNTMLVMVSVIHRSSIHRVSASRLKPRNLSISEHCTCPMRLA